MLCLIMTVNGLTTRWYVRFHNIKLLNKRRGDISFKPQLSGANMSAASMLQNERIERMKIYLLVISKSSALFNRLRLLINSLTID